MYVYVNTSFAPSPPPSIPGALSSMCGSSGVTAPPITTFSSVTSGAATSVSLGSNRAFLGSARRDERRKRCRRSADAGRQSRRTAKAAARVKGESVRRMNLDLDSRRSASSHDRLISKWGSQSSLFLTFRSSLARSKCRVSFSLFAVFGTI